MGCGASNEERPQQQHQGNVNLARPSEPTPTPQQKPGIPAAAIVVPVMGKPVGNANLQTTLQKMGLPLGFLNSITPAGLKSNSPPTPIYWVASVLASHPKILAKILTSNNGALTATCYNAGVPTPIVAEDSYPINGNGHPFFTTTTTGDVWPMVLEKAWAQNTPGGYDGLYKMDIMNAWQSVTGAPVNTMGAPRGNLDDHSLWEPLLEKGYPMAMYESDPNTGRIISGFTILKVINYTGYHIIKFRDNLGTYKHDSATNDPRQSDDKDLHKAITFPDPDPAVQWLYMEDFGAKFADKGTVYCCFYEDNWSYKYATATAQVKHPEYFEITVTKKCTWNISAHQSVNPAVANKYSDLHVECLVKKQNLFGSMVDWCLDASAPTVWYDYGTDDRYATNSERCIPFHKGEVDPGSYIVSVKARNKENVPTNFTVSVLSSKPVEIKRLEKTGLGGLSGFLARRQFQPDSSWNYLVDSDSFGYDCKVNRGFWWTKHAHVFQLINEGAKPWNITIKFPKLFNYKVGKPFRTGPKEIKVQIAPGKSEIVYLKRVPTYERVTDFDGDSELTEHVPFKWEYVSDIN
jgi:hypothetical protein